MFYFFITAAKTFKMSTSAQYYKMEKSNQNGIEVMLWEAYHFPLTTQQLTYTLYFSKALMPYVSNSERDPESEDAEENFPWPHLSEISGIPADSGRMTSNDLGWW